MHTDVTQIITKAYPTLTDGGKKIADFLIQKLCIVIFSGSSDKMLFTLLKNSSPLSSGLLPSR